MQKGKALNHHIIIVNYNSGSWLQRAVQSALEHSTGNISVVDNASKDSSVETCRTHFKDESRIKWILNKDNVGFAAANNQVLASLDEELAVLMNPDCELHERTLEQISAVFQSDPSVGMASCRILNEDGSLQTTCRRRFPTPQTAAIRMSGLRSFFPNADFDYGDSVRASDPVEHVEAVSGAFMVVRKSAMLDVGLLDESYFMHCEDLDWCMRFNLREWNIAFIPAAQVTHAKGVSSRSRPIGVLWNLHRGMDRFFNKFYAQGRPLLTICVRAAVYLSFLPRALLSLVKRS